MSSASEEFEAARVTYFRAEERLETAVLAVLAEQVRERFPTATAVNAYGEMNESYDLVLRIRTVVSGDEVLFDVDDPQDDGDVDWADELDSEYLNWLITLNEDDYRGDNAILVAEPVSA